MTDRLFRFKQFSLRQDHSAMRITTDGVLLGAWASCGDGGGVLDIGAGTGLITLMMTQRCRGTVTALEPDEASCHDLRYNVTHAPWPGRILPLCMSLQDYMHRTEGRERFDSIVSNPPFFSGDKLPGDAAKRRSRHAVTLTHEELIAAGAALLTPTGCLSLILPARYEQEIIALASRHRLYCNRLLHVQPRKEKPVHRVLLEFGRKKMPLQTTSLIIHSDTDYSEEYKDLTKAYYPAF